MTTTTNGINGTNGTNTANGESHAYTTNGHANGDSHTNDTTGITYTTNGHPNGVSHTGERNDITAPGQLNGNVLLSDLGSVDLARQTAIPIAICGIGLRIPGGSSTPEEFWEFLVNKGDAKQRVPESRYNVSAYHETSKRPTTVASEYGYFLDESVKLNAMDTSRFSMGRVELEYADPQQRRLLEVVTESFEDAGEANVKGKKIGCYFGNMNEDWGEMMNRDPLWHGPNKIDGYQDWILPNRISYEFGLTGPSMVIRTACSSALMGVNEACSAMQRGICESAIVAGANLMLAPGMTQQMTEKGILSPEGSCKSFSADADGYARGEAFVSVFLKPLDAAIRDGNPIRAVIRAAVANSDGKTQGITQPNSVTHEEMIRLAYKQAGITDYSKTAYFECHGTGTPVGDPIETRAVANVFGDDGIHITSVKPNVGHTEGASGLVSLVKAVMSLKHRTIPPNIKFNSPNPKIPFTERKLTVPIEPTPFPKDRHERVSVNSFGLGGSNAHVIVDSVRSFNIPQPSSLDDGEIDGPQLLLFSAASAPSLKSMAQQYGDWVQAESENAGTLHDLAYTLACRRDHLTHRSYMVTGSNEIAPSQGKKIPSQPVNLVMVFTGQGAQWPRMGRDLLLRDDLVFQTTIRALDGYLEAILDAPEWTIEAELQKSAKTSRVHLAELSQPICTAVQIGLVNLLASIDVEPAAVVGHSSGELAAAYAAGALTAKEAIIGAYQRGQAAKLQNKKGAMAAVGLSWAEVEPFLNPPHVVVACENSPKSVTLSGDEQHVQETVARIKESHPDITARLLKVEKAYHSYHMREIGGQYHAMIEGHLEGRKAVKPFFSSVTGTGKPEERILDAKYWQQNLESPVLFSPALSGILEQIKNPAFVEVGPHGALAGPARQIFAKSSVTPPYLSVMTRNENCVQTYLSAIGKLFELNIPFDHAAIAPSGRAICDLPRYPWNYEGEFWAESRISAEWRNPRFPRHPLLGRHQLECSSLEPSWRNMLNIEDAPWLRDHVIQDTVVFPAAGYIAMVGEAIRQLTGVEDSYSVRHMSLMQALILQEGVDTEILTNLRPQRLNGQPDNKWWEFSIASYNGNMWVSHCVGQVSAVHGAEPAKALQASPLPRTIDTVKVFNILEKAGMQYGPAFQLLSNITAGTTERKAIGSLAKRLNGDESKYHLHPTIIDAVLQMGLVAARNGKLDVTNCAAMPTLIDDVTIFRSVSDMEMTAVALTELQHPSGEISGAFTVIADGKIVLDMPNSGFTPIEQGSKGARNLLPVTGRIVWGPHIDFVNPAELIKPELDGAKWMPLLEELGELCYVFFQRRIADVTSISQRPAVQKFVSWVGRQFAALDKNHPAHTLDLESIVNRAHAIGEIMADSPLSPCCECLLEVGGSIDELLTGDIELVDLLRKDDMLTRMFASAHTFNHQPFIKALAHSRPSLRVLEIGGSTGQMTDLMMNGLVHASGASLYFKYTFADASSAALSDAKKRYQHLDNMEYRVLDIGKDPSGQGFEDTDKYDLIVASNIIHATENLAFSLTNVHKLLAPGGRLLLQELNTTSKWINCILGFLDDWWVGENDGRPDQPYVAPSQWDLELRRAGFAAPETLLDCPAPHQLCAAMIARPESDVKPALQRAVTVLAHQTDGKNVELLSQKLESHGYNVLTSRLGDGVQGGSGDIISLLDEDQPFFENVEETNFKALQQLLADVGDSGLFWITRGAQMQVKDPRYAQVIGAVRSIRQEDSIDFATCEVDDVSASLDDVVDAFTQFQNRREDEFFRPNYEYAIVDGSINVPRVYPFTFEDERASTRPVNEVVSLVAEKPGRVNSLRWESRQSKPLVGNEVEIEVYCAELSSKDVSAILGIAKYPENGLGAGASGRILAVGPEVKAFAAGDRVITIAPKSLSSHLVTSDDLVQKIPDSLSFEDAATLPRAYATAIAALYNAGGLMTGQSVLIHNATSTVGLAAVQLAQASKATVYATVSTEAEEYYLSNTFCLPRTQIFSMTNSSFSNEILRATNGQGVDIALSSLSGELQHATWQSISEFGKLVETDTADLAGSRNLDLNASGCRTYARVSLEALVAKKQAIAKDLLHSVVKYLEGGRIVSTALNTVYEASTVEEAIKHVQEKTLGTAILQIRDSNGKLRIALDRIKVVDESLALDTSASYLLAGGLGGIGTVIARYLVENGARRIVCFSRNPGSRQSDLDAIREFESMGCEMVLVKGDMAVKEDVFNAVRQAPKLKGILHAPMLLQDESFRNMTLAQWQKATAPKINGAWYLHDATVEAGIELDFFVFLSSMSGLTGQPGQANYAGANTFLDAFALWRNTNGHPASSINIGAVADMGYAARDQQMLQRLLKTGYSGTTESEMIEAFCAAASYPVPDVRIDTKKAPFAHPNVFATGFGSDKPYSHPDARPHWKKDIRTAVWYNTGDEDSGEANSGGDGFKAFLTAAKMDPDVLRKAETASYIALEIGKQLLKLLLRSDEEIDITLPVQQLGLDSLVGIELRSWWRQTFGFDISVLQLLGFGTLEELGKQAVKGLAPADK